MRRCAFRFTLAIIIALLGSNAIAAGNVGMTIGSPTPITSSGRFMNPVWAPNGKGLLFTGERFNGLYYMDPAGKTITVSDQPYSGYGFAWSPDGKNIAFKVPGDDMDSVNLMIADTEGKAKQIASDVDKTTQLRWDKNGLNAKIGDELVTTDKDGNIKESQSLSQGRGLLARIMNVAGPMMTANITGATFTALPAIASVKQGEGKASNKVFLDNESQVWITDENGDAKKLIDVPGVPGYTNPTASPNQDKYAVQGFDGNIYIADQSAGNPTNLGEGSNPVWSPDGRYVMYVRSRDDGHRLTSSDLWLSSVDGRQMLQMTNGQGVIENPSWSPDGKWVAYVADGVVYVVPIEQ